MAASFLRSVRRISYNYSIFLGKWTATGSGSYPRGAPRMNLSTVSSSPSKISKNSSPWLMLPPPPPASEGGVMSFKFYSLAENKVLTLTGSEEKELTTKLRRDRRFRFRGSSLGWIALLNPHNLDLFLYNPISRRHIKLPPIRKLPNLPMYTRDVTKVILSCSPDEDEVNCRAMMIYNGIDALAFCWPGHSKEWTPIGEMRWWNECKGEIWSRGYVDCVYSTREKVFFGLSTFGELESWDLQDPSSPKVIQVMEVDEDKIFTHFDDILNTVCKYKKHLVVTPEQDLLMVKQYAAECVAPDGSYLLYSEDCFYMTKDFNVQKYNPDKGDFEYVDGSSLGGLALFLGYHSHSVALPAAATPDLKPNSIYFTDAFEPEPRGTFDVDYAGRPYEDGGHDIGIFNYEDKTVSSCYYPCDVGSLKRIMPPPMWFFPSLGSVD
ncbi:hypothetical protein OROHE_026540 [Orobanche hederae]